MAKLKGRPNGLVLHGPTLEVVLACRGILKKDFAADVEVSPGYLADLLARRCGASRQIAARFCGALGVPQEALFPELGGWIAPLVDRDAKRERVA